MGACEPSQLRHRHAPVGSRMIRRFIKWLNRPTAMQQAILDFNAARQLPAITASDAGRNLAELGRLADRERCRATARAMWAKQRPGVPVPAYLEPRG